MKSAAWIKAGILGLTLSGGGAIAADDAASRVEAARAALAAAQAELAAAEASLASEQIEVVQPDEGGEVPDAVQTKPKAFKDWDFSADIGLNGATGNTENLSFRAGVGGEKKTDRAESTITLAYNFATSEGAKSANRFEARGRHDWLVPESKWRYFVQGGYEYDEFQAWDHRLSGFAGVGYEFINNDKTTLIGRAGVGGSYEIGGPDEGFSPEGILGLDLTHKLSDKATFKAGTEYIPSFDDFGQFRWNNYAEYDVLIDEATNTHFKAGVKHRHDSDPGSGIQNNDLDYYMGLGWEF